MNERLRKQGKTSVGTVIIRAARACRIWEKGYCAVKGNIDDAFFATLIDLTEQEGWARICKIKISRPLSHP